jgi:hypothetical protein
LSKGHFLKRIDGGLARLQVDEILQYLFCIVEGNVRADQRGMGYETDERTAGPDFTSDDLRKMESVARFIGKTHAKGRGIAQSQAR